MYKCKECGAEYSEKPDYCDCGNDEFCEVVSQKDSDLFNTVKEEIKPTEKPSPMPAENYAKIMSGNRDNIQISPISLIVFLLCVLLSFYVIFFAWNSTDTNVVDIPKEEYKTTSNIPSIEKFWDNTLPVVEKKDKDISEQTKINKINEVTDIKKQPQQIKTPPAAQKQITPKITKVPLTKIQTPVKKTAPKVNNSNTEIKKITKEDELKKQKEEAKKREQAEKEALEKKLAAEKAKLEAEKKAKIATEEAKNRSALLQEYNSYKSKLRNTIGQKIDFTKVIGDGACTVSFKIDSNGKLVNRSFSKQSENITLNDAVYRAVMQTPSFNPPPEGYNNETLNLNIKFYNGNFEISIL